MYYVNDGVYGSFNCILYDHAHVKPLLQKVPSKYVVYTSWKMTGQNKCKQVCFSLKCRDPNQMRSIIHPASGDPPVTAWTALLSAVTCLRCMWVIGCSLRTWVLTLLLLLPPSMDSRDLPSTTWCQGQRGNSCSRSGPRTSRLEWRSQTSVPCPCPVPRRAAWSGTQQPALPLVLTCRYHS